MENIILFDDDKRNNFLPLTFTRPIAELRIGILTIREKWEKYLQGKASYITQDYLSEKYPIKISEYNIIVNACYLPTEALVERINTLKSNEALLNNGELVAAKITDSQLELLQDIDDGSELIGSDTSDIEIVRINNIWDIFQKNGNEIVKDFKLLTKDRYSLSLSHTNKLIGEHAVFIEQGSMVEGSILNTTAGPIYIGYGAEVMEGSMIRGPFSLGDHGVIKMGAKMYGDTSIGPGCKVGGEITNSVFLSNSNKAHDGFIGNSVIGEWCNIGADSNNSNLKNNYDEVKLWDYSSNRFKSTGQQFLGLIMGDHSKCAINTMFNTGTVVGVSANVFGAGFPRNFIPSFSWGGAAGFTTYKLEKALETMRRVFARRNKELSDVDQKIMSHIFDFTHQYRTWEKD
ncbi:MAG: GlmU family protein [Saprospiraceae bacterium]|nr:GlmU family protein [Saprospiraceae bacterium]